MFKFLDKKTRVLKSIVKTLQAQKYKVEIDLNSLSAFIEHNDLSFILQVDDKSVLVISSVLLDADFTVRKSFSDIVNLCFGFGVSVSGLKYAGFNMNTVTLAIEFSLKEPKKIYSALYSLITSIREIDQYCERLMKIRDEAHWDLSMFEDLDLSARSLVRIAEIKEFTVGSWADMAKQGWETDAIINALADFEIKNKVNLSCVAEFLEKELLRISDETFSDGSKLLN